TWSCQEEFSNKEKYQRPDWLAGKILTQLQKEDDLRTFVALLEKTRYDSVLNTSGSFTVFAPTNTAFEKFFENNPEYKALLESDGSSEKIEDLITFQILFNAWSKTQIRNLDENGWVDPKFKLSEPRSYKRLTLYHEENEDYQVRKSGSIYLIAPPEEATGFIKEFTRSNKFAPIYYKEFFDVYDLQTSDYTYYFGRNFEPEELYYANARIGQEILAENGFIYKTDEVVLPLPNGEEILKKDYDNYSYSMFLDLLYRFSQFSLNLEETYNQPGAEEGLEIDSLYDLEFPELLFNISVELAGDQNRSNASFFQHNGLLAPTNQALQFFMNEYFSRYGNIQDVPRVIRTIIVNSHMAEHVIYETDIYEGFINGDGDSVLLDPDDIIQSTFGSNCSFLGLAKAIVPRVLTSVCRPMYQTNEFQSMMFATNDTRVLSALKKPNATYSFYIPRDQDIGEGGDSSLLKFPIDVKRDLYRWVSYHIIDKVYSPIQHSVLRDKLLNQIGTSIPDGIAKKEFIRNLGGNYIIMNNETGIVSGTNPSVYNLIDSVIYLTPVELYPGELDNGKVFHVTGWFQFNTGSTYFGMFYQYYPKFLDLLEKADLFKPRLYSFPFLIGSEYYTIFAPTDSAIIKYELDSLAPDELVKVLKYHFIKGELIFTDGKKPSNLYPTLRKDERSTEFRTVFSKLHVNPTPDVIEILDKNGDVYTEIPEKEQLTNRLIGYDTNAESISEWDYIITGVVHTIDKVLIKDSLQVN
ncbi:fasciclin domain-containing protein, partial [Bacteroidota bacterium]